MKDFRNLLSWRNYLRKLNRVDDEKQIINNFRYTANYIYELEGQIVELKIQLDKLQKEVDDGR